MKTIPTIDISGFLCGDPSEKLRVVEQISDACTHLGFFAISGHGVPQNITDNLREAAHMYFEQSDGVKRADIHPIKDTPRGYREFAGESLGKTISKNAPAALKEFFHYGPESWPDELYFTGEEGKNYFIPNIWPDRPADFREVAMRYYGEMERLSIVIIRMMALALGLPEHWFDDKFNRHPTAVRLNYYPIMKEAPPPGHIRAGEHTDFGMLTILMGEETAGGLQVRTRSGDWIDVITKPDFFVINIADLLMRWTNDHWISNMHRVVNPPKGSEPTRGRLSVGYFCQPNYDQSIECIPTCTSLDNPPKYDKVISGEYRDLKYEQGNL